MKQVLETLHTKLTMVEGQYKAHKEQHDTTKKQLEDLKVQLDAAQKALVIAQEVAQKTQQELEYRISDIVTASLAAVFDEPYEFKVRFDIKRNKTEAALMFTKDGHEIDPLTASGGGVVAIASFALRIACFLIKQPQPMKTLVLDECGCHVSQIYQDKFAELMQVLSAKLGIQNILITHIPAYEVGNVIDFS